MTAADIFVKELKDRLIPCIYTLCGNGLDPLLQAAHRAGMPVIDFRNEQSAAYAADTVGRLTGQLGVAMVSTGVAHLNGLTGVSNAWYDGSPMLLVTGGSDSASRGRGHFQDMDTVTLAAPLCKHSEYVARADRMSLDVEAAIDAAISGRPGPTHLTIPVDVLNAEVGELDLPLPRPKSAMAQRGGPADCASITEAVALIAKAERPVIVAGSGCHYADASSELEALAAAMKAPVTVPIWERGAIENRIPEFVGVVGAASGGPRVLPDTDLIILIGSQVDYRVGYLEPPGIGEGAKVIRVSIDAQELNQGYRPDVGLLGDPAHVIRQLLEALSADNHAGTPDWLAEATSRHAEFTSRWAVDACPGAPPFTGQHVINAIRAGIDDDTFLLVDGGNIGQWVHMAMCDRYPARWLTCGRSAVVGWGFPGANAVASLYPDEKILLLSGDGSSTFTIAEIEAAARQKLPYVAIIADDSAWGIVVSGCRKAGQPPVASELGPIDFVKVAEGFGAKGIRAEDPHSLSAAIEAGFAEREVPTIIHAPIATGGPAD